MTIPPPNRRRGSAVVLMLALLALLLVVVAANTANVQHVNAELRLLEKQQTAHWSRHAETASTPATPAP
jgi:hypothetical protein